MNHRLLILFLVACYTPQIAALPAGFVDLDEAIPGLVVELRYYSDQNFVGRPIPGYAANRAILSQPAAAALGRVQAELRPFGLGLKVLDAYRPQRAVDEFVRWARDPGDDAMKAEYYPNVRKRNLIPEGYIAERSGHSRGSTVDLTIVDLAPPHRPIDMGTPFDFFGGASWTHYPDLSPDQRANRLLLHTLMVKQGFIPYPQEWWHFTLAAEPYPETYFDFVLE